MRTDDRLSPEDIVRLNRLEEKAAELEERLEQLLMRLADKRAATAGSSSD